MSLFKRLLCLSLCAALLAGCMDTISDQRRGELRATMAAIGQPPTAAPTPIPTREPSEAALPGLPAPTAIPTPAPTPAFIGPAESVPLELEVAVHTSLAALNPDLALDRFTRTPDGTIVAWVTDANHSETHLCGIPLYFPGLGSLLVLTSTDFFTSIIQMSGRPEKTGCMAFGFKRDKSQVRQLLELFQAIYAAQQNRQTFNSPEAFEAYAAQYPNKFLTSAYPQELNIVIRIINWNEYAYPSYISGNMPGLGHPSSLIMAGKPEDVPNSPVLHVPFGTVCVASFMENDTQTGLLNFFDPRMQIVSEKAPEISVLKSAPLSKDEAIFARLGSEFWQPSLEDLAIASGLKVIAPEFDEKLGSRSPYFRQVLKLSGFQPTYNFYDNPEWSLFQNYLSGINGFLDSSVADKIILRVRAYNRDSYLTFVFID